MIDLSAQIKRSIDEAVKKGNSAEKSNPDRAADAYHTAYKLYLQFADKAPSRALELARKKQALHYREMARRLEAGEPAHAPRSEKRKPASDEASAAPDEEDKIKSAVWDLVVTSPITWDKIGGLEATKKEIKLALAISLAQKPAGVEVSAFRNMLFYGPPGTGKTLLAAATSNALKTGDGKRSCFFNVKVSSVLSKFFGESTRIISELYGTARDTSPAVIFLDEFEALSGSRDGGDSGAERRILSTILAELDGLSEKGRDDIYVLTIAATNRPWDIDGAVLSRFEKKILIPLPDPDSRQRILEIMLTGKGFQLEFEIPELIALTDGYSGRELERLVKDVTGKMIADTNKDLVALFDEDPRKAAKYQIKTRPLRKDAFVDASTTIVPQTKPEEMARYVRWARELE